MQVEGAAVAANAAVLGLGGAAIRGEQLQYGGRARTHARWAASGGVVEIADALNAQREVLEVEQVIGHGGVDGDPRIFTGQYRGRRQHPGAVGLGGQRQADGQGQGGPFYEWVHGSLP